MATTAPGQAREPTTDAKKVSQSTAPPFYRRLGVSPTHASAARSHSSHASRPLQCCSAPPDSRVADLAEVLAAADDRIPRAATNAAPLIALPRAVTIFDGRAITVIEGRRRRRVRGRSDPVGVLRRMMTGSPYPMGSLEYRDQETGASPSTRGIRLTPPSCEPNTGFRTRPSARSCSC
jgi:hypothetical protein